MCGDPCTGPGRHSCNACSLGADDTIEYDLADLTDEEE
jgi:hypothetical protein